MRLKVLVEAAHLFEVAEGENEMLHDGKMEGNIMKMLVLRENKRGN